MNVAMSPETREEYRRAVARQRRSAGRWALACVAVALLFEAGARLLLESPPSPAPHVGDLDELIAVPLRFLAGLVAVVSACLLGLYAKLSADAKKLAETAGPAGAEPPTVPAQRLREQLADAKTQTVRHGLRALALPIAGGLTAGICLAPLLLLQSGTGGALGLLITALVVTGFFVATVANIFGLFSRLSDWRRLAREVRDCELPRATLSTKRPKERS